ncbi:MAG: rod-binding protein [Gemmatimonadaceae bacterium]
MIQGLSPLAALPDVVGTSTEDARLQKVARQLEGVFVQQLFKAMRETVPQDGAVDGGSGEQMFTSMMDEKLADQLPGQWHHGIGEGLIRQLRNALSQSQAVAVPEKK